MAVWSGLASELRHMADIAERELAASESGGNDRYVQAMIASARAMAARMEAAGDASAMLAEGLSLAGAGDAASLAEGLRKGTVNEDNTPGLGDALMDCVRAELAVTNPAFLVRREGGGA